MVRELNSVRARVRDRVRVRVRVIIGLEPWARVCVVVRDRARGRS